MRRRHPLLLALLAVWTVLIAATPARAASLQPVSNWGATGVPSTVSMYIYVPDNVAPNAPILVLVHYCGGTASAVFGQAQGGGVVAAADQNGVIMVVPQAVDSGGAGRCWDVGSDKALTRDGGGDTQAIAQMVQYAISEYDANPDRVYVTGDSSGGMMTEALLALYPDVFKAGAAFAGVPAGCWAVGNPDGSWSGSCAGGTVTHTPDEWGAIVDAMFPGYTGHRPRVQLFHGDGDTTIRYQNHIEAIKEWTNVLGLSAEPTATDTVQLGSHQATRERWENSCGYTVLEAYTSIGGDHGPSDALFAADYVVPFLALDHVGPTDPEIEECGAGTGGAGGAGGADTGGAGGASTGGVNDSGGAPPSGGSDTGGEAPTGGVAPTGGTSPTGGATPTGGAPTGGTVALTGGTAPAGGGTGGGLPTTGGTLATGGTTSPTGGATTGGGSALGGAPGSGGSTVAGGTVSSGGTLATGGSGAVPAPASDGDSSEGGGCGCRQAGGTSRSGLFDALGMVALLALRSRRRRPSPRG